MPLDSSGCVWRDSNSQALCAPRFELGVFTCFTTNTRTPQQWFHCCGVTSPSIRSRGGTFKPPLSILPLVTKKVAATTGNCRPVARATVCCWITPGLTQALIPRLGIPVFGCSYPSHPHYPVFRGVPQASRRVILSAALAACTPVATGPHALQISWHVADGASGW